MTKNDSFGLVPTSIARSKLSPGAKALYLLLATYADKKRTCFPSKSLLCEELGVNEKTLERYLKQLVEAGAVKVKQQRNKNRWGSNYYQLTDKVSAPLFLGHQKVPVSTPKMSASAPQFFPFQHPKNGATNYTIEQYHRTIPDEDNPNDYSLAYK